MVFIMTNEMNAKMAAAWKAVDVVDAGYLFEVIDLYDALAAYARVVDDCKNWTLPEWERCHLDREADRAFFRVNEAFKTLRAVTLPREILDALAAYGFTPPRQGAVAVVEPEYEEILSEDF